MIPINTTQPPRNKAYITYGLILLNAIIFLWELTLSPRELYNAYYALSLVPCQIGGAPVGETLLDVVRSMFLHGSWAHLVGNMTFLWIFGRNIEDYLGHRKFLALYIVTGFIAAFTETLLHSNMCIPMIGASGAIAGVLGAFLIFFPGVRIRIMIIFFRFFPRFYNVPSLVILGFWFALQLFNGVASLGVETAGGGVAFFAHIGGFVAGMIGAFIYTMFNPPPPRPLYKD
jgi:membrane associated rhomboid family serine protease